MQLWSWAEQAVQVNCPHRAPTHSTLALPCPPLRQLSVGWRRPILPAWFATDYFRNNNCWSHVRNCCRCYNFRSHPTSCCLEKTVRALTEDANEHRWTLRLSCWACPVAPAPAAPLTKTQRSSSCCRGRSRAAGR